VSDYDLNSFSARKKHYLYLLLALAILIPIGVYVFFYFQPPVYKSSGKFAVFYSNNSESQTGGLQTNSDLTKSVAESIQSRYFLEKISGSSGVTFDQKALDSNIGNIVKTSVVTNSNIINVEFDDKSTNNLNKINNVFLNQLNATKIVTNMNSLVTIQTIDPLYTSPKPTYPQPLTYALATFGVIVVVGLLLIYTLTP